MAPGPNGFDLVASDAVGNVALTRISTLLDIEPPQVLRTELSRPEGSGGPIRLQVQARVLWRRQPGWRDGRQRPACPDFYRTPVLCAVLLP